MLSLPSPPARAVAQDTGDVAVAAISAYAAVCPMLPYTTLTYDEARRHETGDSLAEFLVIELTEGCDGGTEPARFRHAADQLDHMIGSLVHVRDRLIEHAARSGCLPLDLDDAVDRRRNAHRLCA